MLPDRVSNPGALPIALRGPAERVLNSGVSDQNRLRPDCADVTIAVSFS